MKVNSYGAGVFAISGYLTEQECEQCVVLAEAIGFEEAEITTLSGSVVFKDIRNNDRVIFDHVNLAADLFSKAKSLLPRELDGWELCGFNERFRFYRYESGRYFKWHRDGSYERNDSERSLLTFLIYLNDDYSGGETAFRWEKVEPQIGVALVFPHSLLHQGNEIVSGVKYVLRTDVMYRKSAQRVCPEKQGATKDSAFVC